MAAAKVGLIVSVLALGGCCLTTVSELSGEPTSGGVASAGGVPGGGSASSGGGSTTGANPCSGIYCAPSFVCDPTDGVCKCDGQTCFGNCGADSGACLIACDADGGTYPVVGQSPYAVRMPTAHLGKTYAYAPQAACGVPPVNWRLLAFGGTSSNPGGPPLALESIGLTFYQGHGEIEGTPTVASDAGPFELELEAEDQAFNTGVQNYLLEVVGPEP
jgi:hypothetical protein